MEDLAPLISDDVPGRLRCPHCGARDSQVRDSRPVRDGIRRRRLCEGCGVRFNTLEQVQIDGESSFDRAKAIRMYGELSDLPRDQRRLIELLIRSLARDAARYRPEPEIAEVKVEAT